LLHSWLAIAIDGATIAYIFSRLELEISLRQPQTPLCRAQDICIKSVSKEFAV
jgi:hypothetical protein